MPHFLRRKNNYSAISSKVTARLYSRTNLQRAKSAAQGIDLEFVNHNTHYIVSIKSGPNWGQPVRNIACRSGSARRRDSAMRQSRWPSMCNPFLAFCYGKNELNSQTDGYLKGRRLGNFGI